MTSFLKDRYTETEEEYYYIDDVWDSGDTENSTRYTHSENVIDTQDCTLGEVKWGSGVSVEGNIITLTRSEENLSSYDQYIANVSYGYGGETGIILVYAKKKSTS